MLDFEYMFASLFISTSYLPFCMTFGTSFKSESRRSGGSGEGPQIRDSAGDSCAKNQASKLVPKRKIAG